MQYPFQQKLTSRGQHGEKLSKTASHGGQSHDRNIVHALASQPTALASSLASSTIIRPPHIVTVCVLGRKPKRPKHNGRSIRLLDQVVDAVISRADWHSVDAIVFPGGFFRSPAYVGNRSHSERAAALEALDFGQAVMAAAYRLDTAHPGVLIVVGIDSVPYSSDLVSFPGREVKG
jgi:hypothetical protein